MNSLPTDLVNIIMTYKSQIDMNDSLCKIKTIEYDIKKCMDETTRKLDGKITTYQNELHFEGSDPNTLFVLTNVIPTEFGCSYDKKTTIESCGINNTVDIWETTEEDEGMFF